MNIQTNAPTRLPQELKFGQSNSTPTAPEESAFGLDVVEFQSSQVKADNDLYPGCTGELAMSGCMANSSVRDVKSGDLDWQGVAFCSAAASDIESSFLAGNLHV